jgi:hypothetical protein
MHDAAGNSARKIAIKEKLNFVAPSVENSFEDGRSTVHVGQFDFAR